MLAAVLLLAAALRAAAWSTPVAVLDGWAMPDDTFLSLELAVQIAQGNGPLYGDAPTSGFQPLIVLATAAIVRAAGWHDRLGSVGELDALARVPMALGALGDLLVVGLLWALGPRAARTTAGALAAPLLWALHPAALRMSVNGLETSLAVAATLALTLGLGAALRRPRCRRTAWGLGALAGVAGLARVDQLLVAALAAGWWWAAAGRDGLRVGERLATAARVLGGFLVVQAPWVWALAAWTGRVVPVSGPAVRELSLGPVREAGLWYSLLWDVPKIGVEALVLNGGDLMVAAALAGGAAAVVARRMDAAPAPPAGRAEERAGGGDGFGAPLGFLALASVVLFFAYAWIVMGWWFFDRYLMPVSLVWVVAAAAGVDAAAARSPRAGTLLLAGAVALVVARGATHPQNHYAGFLRREADPDLSYRLFALWAARETPPGTVVGALQTGALAYYARDLEVVNLDGVVNEAAYAAIRAGRLLDYVHARGVEVMYLWPSNLRFLLARSGERAVAEPPRVVARVDGLRSWKSVWLIVEP